MGPTKKQNSSRAAVYHVRCSDLADGISALSWFKISFNLDVTVRTPQHVIFFHMALILVHWIFQEGLVLILANITNNAFLNKIIREKHYSANTALTTHDQRRSRFNVNPAIFYPLWSATLGLGSVGELNCNRGFPGAKEWFNSLVGNISVVTDLLLPCLIEPSLTTSARKLYKRKFLESLHVRISFSLCAALYVTSSAVSLTMSIVQRANYIEW